MTYEPEWCTDIITEPGEEDTTAWQDHPAEQRAGQGEYIEELDRLDQGFEAVYDRVRAELLQDKSRYRAEIARMQELIQKITDKIVTVNAGNMRNKTLAENQFQKKRTTIGTGASKNRAARNYYNSMNNLNYVSPQFYDSKK